MRDMYIPKSAQQREIANYQGANQVSSYDRSTRDEEQLNSSEYMKLRNVQNAPLDYQLNQ
jgi:hypothetical protein